MEKKLTPRQEEILNYIKKYTAMHGYPPAIREICAGVGLNSPATVFVHIKNLEKNGYIKSTNNKFRTIELLVDNEYLEKNEDVVKVPLLGKITAGNPITAIEQPDEYFDLPASLMPKSGEVFTLHVSGESMINKGIFDDDYVIVKRQNDAKNGDIVVAMTEENEVTLKTFYKEKDHIRLQPENDTMEPLIFPNVTILGKAIGLYRKI
ncbi:MAG TPA: transcriptional repressor LexA [Candidatus Onthocola stercoravium]|nr:transcriptional repressor LexA [Candidatus Onthocola stercoravium]